MKLLVAYLATPGGEDAIALGVSLARALAASLDICVVIPPEIPGSSADADHYAEVLDEAARHWLDEAATLVPDDITTRTHVAVHENTADGLIKEIERIDAALLVAGGSGGGITGPHSLGSVVNDLLHSCSVPMALAPRGYSHLTAGGFRQITAAIGSRPGADILLDTAVDICARSRLPLRLVSLVARDDLPPRHSAEDDTLAHTAAVERARGAIDAAHARLPQSTPVSSTIAEGDSVEDAVATVEWDDGDIILVGSSRLAAPMRLFLGSTAAKMLRVLAIPMMVVPGPEQR